MGALKVYHNHIYANAIDLVDNIIENLDSGYEKSESILSMSSKPSSIGMSKTSASAIHASNAAHPQPKEKIERLYRSDGEEFYQLLSYKGDVDLEVKLHQREQF